MNEDQKKEVATFRFGVIHDVVGGLFLKPGEKERLIREKCVRKWAIPYSDKTRITRSTILRWIKLYRESGNKIESLYPRDRSDIGQSRVLDEEAGLALIELKKEMPDATIQILIKEMNERGLVNPDLSPSPSTLYRFLHAHGLMSRTPKAVDRRKFEAERPNDLWQSDVMHGPKVEHGGKNRKTYLIAFIDDHSRLVPYCGFYLSESTKAFLDALKQALLSRGLPRKLYTDNGPAFRSKHLDHVCASLGVALIHSRPYRPQGRGKIERWFKTIRTGFLTGFKGKTLPDLNEALDLWVRHFYHQRIHSATGQTPFARFTAHMECIRSAPDDLLDHFRVAARRKVAKDRTISLNGKVFEAPVELISKQVTVLYHPDEPDRVEVKLGKTSYGFLSPVDLHVNCRVKRTKNRDLEISTDQERGRYRGGRLWDKGGEK